MSGIFISIEGGEGAGKSTVAVAIRNLLEALGFEVVQTREPGGTTVGESIRKLLLDPQFSLNAKTELLLMFASRQQLVSELIKPALTRGACVISDRFTDASFAYQGGGRGVEMGLVAEMERQFAGIRPDLTFYLDVDVDTGLARARSRGVELDRIEQEQAEFFERVRSVYRQRAAHEPDRIVLIDATQDAQRVADDVTSALHQWLRQR